MTSRGAAFGAVMGSLLLGCGRSSTPPPTVVAAARPAPMAFPDDSGPLPRYHSKRLSVSIPLPDGRSWLIDDHSRSELVATHAPTRSEVIFALFRTDELVGRARCEAIARARKLVPSGEMRTLEDDAAFTQDTFDTRIWVALEPGRGPEGALVGHVMAFGGFLRKCFAFVFTTAVDGAVDEPVLSSRLAFARTRILGGIELDVFGAVPRDVPVER